MGKKNTFIMKTEWGKMISALPDEAAGKIIKAVYSYVETGETGVDDPVLSAILILITDTLDANAAKYEKTCEERKKAIEKRWGNDTKESASIQADTKVYKSIQPDTDNEYEYDNDSDNESVSDNEYPTDTKKTSCGKRSENRSPLEPEADTAAIPLNDGSAWRPPISLYETYEQSYPAVDLPQEFNKMRSWCLSNPKNCKTRNGVKRFVNNWLVKAQDHAARQPTGRASPHQHSNSDVLLSIINGGAV